MKKQEALSHIRKKVGYVPSVMIFEIYSDEDEIPQGLIDMSIRDAKPRRQVIYGGVKFFNELEKAFKKGKQ